jgi:hypothetical protein
VIGSSTRVQVGGQTLRSKIHYRMGDHLERTVALNQNRPQSPVLFHENKATHRSQQDRCKPRKTGPERLQREAANTPQRLLASSLGSLGGAKRRKVAGSTSFAQELIVKSKLTQRNIQCNVAYLFVILRCPRRTHCFSEKFSFVRSNIERGGLHHQILGYME